MLLRKVAPVAVVIVMISGCSDFPSTIVANQTGKPFELLHGRGGGVLGGFIEDRDTWSVLRPGQARKFYVHLLLRGTSESRVVRVRTGGCEYVYSPPNERWTPEPWDLPVLQVQADMTVTLRSDDLHPALSQPSGFPLVPQKICSALTGGKGQNP